MTTKRYRRAQQRSLNQTIIAEADPSVTSISAQQTCFICFMQSCLYKIKSERSMCELQLQDLQPFPAPVALGGLQPVQMAAKTAYADPSTYVIPQRFARSQEVILNSHQRVYHAPLFQFHPCHSHASACEAATGCMYLGHACISQ